jgi:predicted phosphodiesterase
MRLGVVSDIHANAPALDAALAFLATQAVDGYLCAGDLVGYGPAPNECVHRVCALPGQVVAGNHDLIAIGELGDDRCDRRARDSLRWTSGVLEEEARGLLRALARSARADGVAVYHGSPADPREYVRTEAQALACLDELARVAPGAEVLVLGHTHEPFAVGRRRGTLLKGGTGSVGLEPGEPMLLNPGSVGQSRSRDPRARVMVLDLADRTATFHAVAYDVAACRAALRALGLPADSCHPWRPRWRAALHALAGARDG